VNPATAYLGLGSNLGEREETIRRAVGALAGHPEIEVRQIAEPIETEPVGPPGQGPYLNAAVEVGTTLPPQQLLSICKDIEEHLGREPGGERWGPRTIDLDILLYGEEVIDEPGLTVPHMELYRRRFALEPLSRIAPEARHPVLGLTVAELLAMQGQADEGEDASR
jgi:2-amino-4-hydroxy-6-hydroxymethyldihydropteridine diphosphokinase